MDDDRFWREYNDLADDEYFHEHQDDYGGHSRGGHPIYWIVVIIIAFALGIRYTDAPGMPLLFLALAWKLSSTLFN